MVKRIGDYELRSTLGQGTFSKVKLAVNLRDQTKWAIKVVDRKMLAREKMDDQLRREIAIMKLLNHKNVVQLKEVLQTQKHIYMVMELITGGELFDRIVQAKRFTEDVARGYMHQLVRGVAYCHQQGVCHRDLKPENLLLSGDNTVKISDFGLSAVGKDRMLRTTCGTPNYVAPEVLYEKGYAGEPADVWSLGVILFVMLAGWLPFDDPNMDSLFRKIQKARVEYPKWFSSDAVDLIRRMLNPDPRKRYTLTHVKAHPWFAKGFVEEEAVISKIKPTDSDLHNALRESSLPDSAVHVDETGTYSKPQPLNAFELTSRLTAGLFGGLVQSMNGMYVAHTNFMSQGHNPESALKRVAGILQSMGAEINVKEDVSLIKAVSAVPGRRPMIFVIRVHPTVSDQLCLIEVNRRRGDILIFHELYRRIVEQYTGSKQA